MRGKEDCFGGAFSPVGNDGRVVKSVVRLKAELDYIARLDLGKVNKSCLRPCAFVVYQKSVKLIYPCPRRGAVFGADIKPAESGGVVHDAAAGKKNL